MVKLAKLPLFLRPTIVLTAIYGLGRKGDRSCGRAPHSKPCTGAYNSLNKLALWVYPLQNAEVAMDTVVELDKPLRLTSRQNMIFTARVPT